MPTGQYKGSAIVGDMGLMSSSKSIKSSGVPKVLSPENSVEAQTPHNIDTKMLTRTNCIDDKPPSVAPSKSYRQGEKQQNLSPVADFESQELHNMKTVDLITVPNLHDNNSTNLLSDSDKSGEIQQVEAAIADLETDMKEGEEMKNKNEVSHCDRSLLGSSAPQGMP